MIETTLAEMIQYVVDTQLKSDEDLPAGSPTVRSLLQRATHVSVAYEIARILELTDDDADEITNMIGKANCGELIVKYLSETGYFE